MIKSGQERPIEKGARELQGKIKGKRGGMGLGWDEGLYWIG